MNQGNTLEKIEKAMRELPSPWLFKWHPLGKVQRRIDREIAEEEREEKEREEALESKR
jgi:hypothetical protein